MTRDPKQSYVQRYDAAVAVVAEIVNEQREALLQRILAVADRENLHDMRQAASLPEELWRGNRIEDAISNRYATALSQVRATDEITLTQLGETTPLVKSSPERGVREILNRAILAARADATERPVALRVPADRGLGR